MLIKINIDCWNRPINIITLKTFSLQTAMSNGKSHPLISAIRMGRLKEVKELIKFFGICNAEDGYMSLIHATKNKQMKIVKLLLTNGCIVNIKNNQSTNTPLHFAVINEDLKSIKMLLDRCADANAHGDHGQTPLHNAVDGIKVPLQPAAFINYYGREIKIINLHFNEANVKIAKLLLNRGANVNARTTNGLTTLHVAVQKQCPEVVEILLKYNADVNAAFDNGTTPLHLAIKARDTNICKLLLNKGSNVNAEITDLSLLPRGLVKIQGMTPLFIAAQLGQVQIAEDLLYHGAQVNSLCTSIEGDNLIPLHIATKNRHKEIVKLLLDHGAEVDAPYKDGKTIFYHTVEFLRCEGDVLTHKPSIQNSMFYAEQRTCLIIAGVLLSSGAAIDIHSQTGVTLFFASVANGDYDITKLLLNKGINVNVTVYGMTALHIACARGHEEIAGLLLRSGADCESRGRKYRTPFHFAGKGGYEQPIEILLKFNADINSKDIRGRTALHIASKLGHAQFVYNLLDCGSDINIISKDNRTPLDDAMTHFQLLTGRILKQHILKRHAANLYVIKENLQFAHWDNLNEFYCDCKREVERMKTKTIYKENKTTFYNILSKGIKQWAIYTENENITRVLQSFDYKEEFPMYASLIENNFKRGQKRQPLIKPSIDSLNSLFRGRLPQLFMEEMFSYLSDPDLQNLIKAGSYTDSFNITIT